MKKTKRVKQPESIERFLDSRFAADETTEHLHPPIEVTEQFPEDKRSSFVIYEFAMPPLVLPQVSKSKEYYGNTPANWLPAWQGIPLESFFNCIVTKTPLIDVWDGNQVVYAHDNYAKARGSVAWVNLFDDGSLIRAVLSIRYDQSDSWPKKGKSFIAARPRSVRVAGIRFEIVDAKDIQLGEPVQMIWDATLEICPERVRALHELSLIHI